MDEAGKWMNEYQVTYLIVKNKFKIRIICVDLAREKKFTTSLV